MTVDGCDFSTTILGATILVGYAVLEYWLGRTQKTRAASLLELIAMGTTLLVTIILLKLRRNHDGSQGN